MAGEQGAAVRRPIPERTHHQPYHAAISCFTAQGAGDAGQRHRAHGGRGSLHGRSRRRGARQSLLARLHRCRPSAPLQHVVLLPASSASRPWPRAAAHQPHLAADRSVAWGLVNQVWTTPRSCRRQLALRGPVRGGPTESYAAVKRLMDTADPGPRRRGARGRAHRPPRALHPHGQEGLAAFLGKAASRTTADEMAARLRARRCPARRRAGITGLTM